MARSEFKKSLSGINRNPIAFATGGWFGVIRRLGGVGVPESSESEPRQTNLAEAKFLPEYPEQLTKDSPAPEEPASLVQVQSSCVYPVAPPDPPALLSLPTPAEAAGIAPEDLQPALARELQRLLVEGLPDIPAPRSIKELSSLVGVWRSLAKLDKQESAGPAVLVAPMRSVHRRRVGPVVDAVEGG